MTSNSISSSWIRFGSRAFHALIFFFHISWVVPKTVSWHGSKYWSLGKPVCVIYLSGWMICAKLHPRKCPGTRCFLLLLPPQTYLHGLFLVFCWGGGVYQQPVSKYRVHPGQVVTLLLIPAQFLNLLCFKDVPFRQPWPMQIQVQSTQKYVVLDFHPDTKAIYTKCQ